MNLLGKNLLGLKSRMLLSPKHKCDVKWVKVWAKVSHMVRVNVNSNSPQLSIRENIGVPCRSTSVWEPSAVRSLRRCIDNCESPTFPAWLSLRRGLWLAPGLDPEQGSADLRNKLDEGILTKSSQQSSDREVRLRQGNFDGASAHIPNKTNYKFIICSEVLSRTHNWIS
jgi:hypothetical protein